MLKPLPNSRLVDESMRRRYADDSTSLTLWFDENGEVLGIEVIFDLLVDEHAFRWIRGTKTRYAKLDSKGTKPGRHIKQILGPENLPMPRSRLADFDERSEKLPPVWRDFVRAKLLEVIEQNP